MVTPEHGKVCVNRQVSPYAYSSGMYAKRNFSVVSIFKPEILLVTVLFKSINVLQSQNAVIRQ